MTTAPYWLEPDPAHPSPAPLPARAEIVVVGGGVMGAAVTYWLARGGVDVLMIEAGESGGGASGRSAGLCLPGGSPLESSSVLAEILAEEAIDADYRVTGHLALASTEAVWQGVQDEVARRPAGAPPLRALSARECEELLGLAVAGRFLGGRHHPGGALVHPWRLVAGLARAARRRGARVAAHTPVRRVVHGGASVVHTTRGRVSCGSVVLACGAGLAALVPALRPVVRVTRGQMLATEPMPPLFAMGMAVDRGAVYWRQTRDGTVILGGCRDEDRAAEDTGVDGINPRIQAALERFLPDAFPDLPRPRVARRWSGVMDFTTDGRPLAGALATGHWVLCGFGGHGLPCAMGFGKALCDSILAGRSSPELDRYSPSRLGL